MPRWVIRAEHSYKINLISDKTSLSFNWIFAQPLELSSAVGYGRVDYPGIFVLVCTETTQSGVLSQGTSCEVAFRGVGEGQALEKRGPSGLLMLTQGTKPLQLFLPGRPLLPTMPSDTWGFVHCQRSHLHVQPPPKRCGVLFAAAHAEFSGTGHFNSCAHFKLLFNFRESAGTVLTMCLKAVGRLLFYYDK